MRKLFIGIGIVLGQATLVSCTAATAASVETIQIAAPDGVELSTDVYLPSGGSAPVILVRTPYGSKQLSFLAESLVAHGYAVAIQDVRGRYGSGGEHEPFRPHERTDGLATLEWLADQEWCDGNIGMWGSSYSGFAALVLADAEVKAFKSIFSISGWISPENVIRPGGAMHLQLNLPWMLTQQGRLQRNLAEFDINALFRHTPLRDAIRAAGLRNETWEDPAWLDAPVQSHSKGEVPRSVFQVTGWHDMVYRSTLDAFRDISSRSKQAQKLAVGPWYHNQMLFGTFEVGDAHFGDASAFGENEMIALTLRWFDATLKHQKNGILEEPPVTYFVMGQNAWAHDTDWPPRGSSVKDVRWYLDSAGSANGSSGNGTLARSKPAGAVSDQFIFDPMNPVPTLGGAVFFYFPELLGVKDQQDIERRNDVLIYTSEPFTEEIQITGAVSVHLYAATSGEDTDFTAKLVVVRPDGYARIVEDGIVRVSAQLEASSAPNISFEVTIDLGHTAISIPEGHRLRLEISSSNFPKYDRNPNNGQDPFLATEFTTARQTVFHSAERSSYLTLPVRRELLVNTEAGQQPLSLPLETVNESTIAVGGNDAAILLAAGREYLATGKVDLAIASLSRAVDLLPRGSIEHMWLGRAYRDKLQSAGMLQKLGLSKKARSHFAKAVEYDPDNIDARTNLALFYFNAPSVAGGSFERGQKQVQEIGTRDPIAAHRLMATVYTDKKQPDKAIEEYHAIIALDAKDESAYLMIGLLHRNEREWEQAFAWFEKDIEMTDSDLSRYSIGRTAVLSGEQLDRGKQALEEYIARKPAGSRLPSLAAAHWRLGMLHELTGRTDLARQHYETALQLEPGMEQARESLKGLEDNVPTKAGERRR